MKGRHAAIAFGKVIPAFLIWAALIVLCASGPVLAQAPGGMITDVHVGGDVTTSARSGGSASTRIGSSVGGRGQSTTRIDGNVYTQSMGGSSSTDIGGQDKDGTTVIRGNVYNLGGHIRAAGNTAIGGDVLTQQGSDVTIGGCGSTYVAGNVVVPGGGLEIGCGCAGRRNGQCCIEFYRGFCVVQMVPPSENGCPPGFMYSDGMCRLYSDFEHKVGN